MTETCDKSLYFPFQYHLHSLPDPGGGAETGSTCEYTVLTEDMYTHTPSILMPSSRGVEWSPQVGGDCGSVSQGTVLPERGRSLSCSSALDKGALLHSLAQQLRQAGLGREERRRRSKRHSMGEMPTTQECWAEQESCEPLPHRCTPQTRLQLPSLTSTSQSKGPLPAAAAGRQLQPAALPLHPATLSVSSTGGARPQWAEPRCPRSTTCKPTLLLADPSALVSHSNSNSHSKLTPSLGSEPSIAQQRGGHESAELKRIPLELALGRNARKVTTPTSTLSTPTTPSWSKQVTRLNSSKVFSSTLFGTILSAAQSTDILTRDEDSEGEEEEEEATVPHLTSMGSASPNPLQDNRWGPLVSMHCPTAPTVTTCAAPADTVASY